jgi:sugar/nucleoside kinase (ribokinase family)
MYDIITIGSATQDVYVFSKKFRVLRDSRAVTGEVECFAFGTKIELDDILFEIGGGATNTAYTFSRQGLKVACLARIGKDGAGEEVRKFLKSAKITDLLVLDRKQRTAHSVVFLAKTGERTILVYRGAAHRFKTSDVQLKKIKNTKWLYITSLAGNLNLLEKLTYMSKKQGIKIALNPGKLEIRASRRRLAKILGRVDILLLNREEAVEVNKRLYSDDKGILSDLKSITKNGIVIVTEGPKGFLMAVDNSFYRVIIKPSKAVDTTGAGDAFGSGFLAGYLKSKGDPIKAFKLALSNSTAVVGKIGAKHGLLAKGNLGKKVKFKIKEIN